jgi:hypothetical protein
MFISRWLSPSQFVAKTRGQYSQRGHECFKDGHKPKKKTEYSNSCGRVYEELATDAVRGRSDLMTDDFEMLMSRVMFDDSLRPLQRLALVYDRNREFYLEPAVFSAYYPGGTMRWKTSLGG